MSVIETDRFSGPRWRSDPDPESSGFQRTYPAIPASVRAARQAITELGDIAGAAREQLEAIRLASSEALSNVVQHAYPRRPGPIHVTARVAGGELWVLISDDGCGFQAGRETDGLGFGLALIAHATDGFTVFERWSGGTELRLRFVIRPESSGRGQERGSVSSATRPAWSRFSTTT